MNRTMKVRDWVSGKLKALARHLETDEAPSSTVPFSDLVPVDNLDSESEYFTALDQALQSDRIVNIAISGPYASGKSSLITSYSKHRSIDFVTISLATFGEQADPNKLQEIEKGILQQLVYNAKSEDTPYSRFQRIKPIRYKALKSAAVVFWTICLLQVIRYREQFNEQVLAAQLAQLQTSPSFEQALAFLLMLTPLFVVTLGLIVAVSLALTTGLSRIKVSTPFLEAEANRGEVVTPLNKYIDEVLYFFEATKTRVVVFEDMDRFEETGIFRKLREINKLLNDGRLPDEYFKFIYAVKDDLFDGADRTKFFDIIIPVVPIINTSNSQDKFIELLTRLGKIKEVDQSLIREASYYINDLRLIKNIVNEFRIYRSHLPLQTYQSSKLMAMMLYKNTYSEDFNQLLHNKGKLFSVCANRETLERELIAAFEAQKQETKELIEASNQESAKDAQELRSVYVMELVRQAQRVGAQGVHAVRVGTQSIPLANIYEADNFQKIVEAEFFKVQQAPNQGAFNQRISFREISFEVDRAATFAERMTAIENKSGGKRAELQALISKTDAQIASARRKPLSELLQAQPQKLDELLDFKPEDKNYDAIELLRSLLLSGHIDENYHDYISNFFEGRLTATDQQYLVQLRSGRVPKPDLPLTNFQEIFIGMRDFDFESSAVLNVSLFDHLLTEKQISSKRTNAAVNFLGQNFQLNEEFIVMYYSKGKWVGDLSRALFDRWPYCGEAVLSSPYSIQHVCNLLVYVDHAVLVSSDVVTAQLRDFLEQNAVGVEAKIDGDSHHKLYQTLGIKFHRLSDLSEHRPLMEFALHNQMYVLVPENISTVMETLERRETGTIPELSTSNFTYIQASGNNALNSYVDRNLDEYVRQVVLVLPDNVQESADAITSLLNNEDLRFECKTALINKQAHVFQSFEGIPAELHEEVFGQQKVKINWINFATIFDENSEEPEKLVELLQDDAVVEQLRNSSFPRNLISEQIAKDLAWFIVSLDELDDLKYQKLIEPTPHKWKAFPDGISEEKTKILARSNKIGLNEDSFMTASRSHELAADLIRANEGSFVRNSDKFALTSDMMIALMSEPLGREARQKIAEEVQVSELLSSQRLSQEFARLMLVEDIDLRGIGYAKVSHLMQFVSSEKQKVTVIANLASSEEPSNIRSLIADLDAPLSEIAESGKRPKVPNTKQNLMLVRSLRDAGIISSATELEDEIQIYNTRW